MSWHKSPVEEIYQSLQTSERGLSDEEVLKKREEVGTNELTEKKKHPLWLIFLMQFKDFMILVLIGAAVISGVIGDLTDAVIILVIVVLNAIVGFVQEFNAEKAMEALKKMATLNAQVIRNGKTVTLPSSELVPGDIINI